MNIRDPEFNYFRACDYAIFGDKKASLRLLNKAVDRGFFNYPFMLKDSSFDLMRNDPEFQKTLLKAKQKHELFKEKYLNTIQ